MVSTHMQWLVCAAAVVLARFGDREGIASWLPGACRGTYVSAFYDIGPLRDHRASYVASVAKLSRVLQRLGCPLFLYCGDDCADFKVHVPDARYLPMANVSRTMYGMPHAYDAVRATIVHMRQAAGHPLGGDMDTFPLEALARYTLVTNAKFAALAGALHEPGDGPLIWIDAGLFRHEPNSRGFAECTELCPVQTATAAFSMSSLGGAWTPRLNSIYLAGPRKELAATVMVFARQWYPSFLTAYTRRLRAMLRKGYVTTEQASLTLMAQHTTFTLMVPSYERIATRMLCAK